MTLYEVPLQCVLTFEEMGKRDVNIRMAVLRTSMDKVSAYVLDRFSVSIDWEFGKPEVLVAQSPFAFDDDEDEPPPAPARKRSSRA